MRYWKNAGDPLYFPTHVPNCLCHVSFRRYLPLSFKVVEKTNKCKSFFGPNLFGRDETDFSMADC